MADDEYGNEVDLDSIEDEATLMQLLDETEDFDERKMIRARLREVQQASRAKREEQMKKREQEREDAIKRRAQESADQKRRTLAMYDQMAKSAPAGGPKVMDIGIYKNDGTAPTIIQPKQDLVEDAIKQRHKEAEDRKKRILAAFDDAAKSGPAGTERIVRFDAFKKADGAPKPVSARDKFQQLDSAAPKATPNFRASNVNRSASDIKEMLLSWCKAKTREYENVEITNFSSCWSDGMAFCALAHHYYPDAFDFSTLEAKNRRSNFDLAFKTLEDKADISPLLDTNDMILMKNKPDWKCVFTYIQSIYRKLRELD